MSHPWEDLLVWQKSHKLVLQVYKLTAVFPTSEKFGLTSQLRRATVSVAANIVEGKSKKTDKEFLHFLHISRGSLEEARYYLLLASHLDYIEPDYYSFLEANCVEVSFLLNQLIKAVAQ